MIPTFFSTLALGTITTMVATIIGLSAWVPGSQIFQGNRFYDTTNNPNPSDYLNNVQKLVWTGASLGFPRNGTQSGVNLTVGDTAPTHTGLGVFQFNCTATGGNVKVSNEAKYDTCFTRLPLSSTGVITAVSMEFASTPVALGLDCGIVTAAVNGTGTVLLNNVQATTGSTLYVDQAEFSGSLLPPGKLPGNQFFKCGTLTVPTSSFSAKGKIWYYDTSAD